LSFVPELKIKMVAAKRQLHGNSPPYPRSREKGREGKGREGQGRGRQTGHGERGSEVRGYVT
jgi:hypothetical protein